MSELVWRKGSIVDRNGRQEFLFDIDRDTIPDVPNLAAVARVLAANPGIGEDIRKGMGSYPDDEHLQAWFDNEPKTRWGLMVRADTLIALRALAAALNGGTE